MAGILRTWFCQNSRCASPQFEAWDANPSCPACRCVRVAWVPGGGHIRGEKTKGAEKELRALVDIFKMTDMNSAQEGRGAKKVNLPSSPAAAGPVQTFAPGFSAPVQRGAGAACMPTSDHVQFKVKAGPGTKLQPNGTFPSVRSGTAFEGAHKP